MIISGKKLLEWNPSSHVRRTDQSSLRISYVSMWIAPVLTVVVFVFLAIDAPQKLLISGPILLMWFIAPFITWFSWQVSGEKYFDQW